MSKRTADYIVYMAKFAMYNMCNKRTKKNTSTQRNGKKIPSIFKAKVAKDVFMRGATGGI